ncbi:MAG: hypothetical protein P1V13_21935 [Rhizobiaceae bacterium]|nr:hypothetical protein [Rhizobiaceae bacterium]
MTLIGRLSFSGFPVMFGDILLSRTNQDYPQPINLPAMSDVNSMLPDEAWGYVSGVTQKLNIIDNNFMVAWAGNYLQARFAISHLKKAIRAGAATSADIKTALNDIAPEIQEISLLGLLVRPNGQPNGVHIASFAVDVETYNINDVDVRLAGTGQWHVKELLPHAIQRNDQIPLIEQAINSSIALSGALIGREMDTASNLAQMWGGAIEIGFVANGRLQKLDRVLHIQSRVVHMGDGVVEFQFWPKLTHYRYLEQYLLISTIELFEQGQPKLERYLVSPMIRNSPPTIEKDSQYHLDFAYDYVCCYTSFEDGISDSGYEVLVIRSAQNELTVVREGDNILIQWEPAFIKRIIDSTRNSLKEGYRYD